MSGLRMMIRDLGTTLLHDKESNKQWTKLGRQVCCGFIVAISTSIDLLIIFGGIFKKQPYYESDKEAG